MSLLNPPARLPFFSGRVPLLLPLAKQTIKSMHGGGRDSTRCRKFSQPTTGLLPRLGCSLPRLIGCCSNTDVSSLMIFVTIKLIVVYGSEMQECRGKWKKGSRLMGMGTFWRGGGVDHGINMGSGAADLGPTVVETVGWHYKGDGDRGFTRTLSCKDIHAHWHTPTWMQGHHLSTNKAMNTEIRAERRLPNSRVYQGVCSLLFM